MPEKDQGLAGILDEMRTVSNLYGIVIATKNGDPVERSLNSECNKIMKDLDNFAAMCATVYQSGIAIAQHSNNKGMNQIIVEMKNFNLIIKECNKNMIFIHLLKKSNNIKEIMVHFDEFLDKIKNVVNN
jgi:predicted regulator of Ras-like GTPase activity (Roadblock/LC7/MglB family)